MIIEIRNSYSFSQLGKRQYQEDSRIPNVDVIINKQKFFAVCDGVGGNCCGEIASNTVCDVINCELKQFDLINDTFSDSDFSNVLYKVYNALDNVANNDNKDMGTTLSFIAFHQEGAMLAHIGDSRIYQIRPNAGIVYRSEDHSLVNEMIKAGIISPEEALHHPRRHVINRAMSPLIAGRGRSSATVFHTTDVKPNDIFLLCSDGVTDTLSDSDIENILSQKMSLQKRVDLLSKRCIDSDDNNTGIIIEIGDVKETPMNGITYTTQVEANSSGHKSLIRRILEIFK